MNGWEIFTKLKSIPEYKNIKIVILTASDQKNNREKAISLKVDGFFSKPVEMDVFMEDIRKIILKQE